MERHIIEKKVITIPMHIRGTIRKLNEEQKMTIHKDTVAITDKEIKNYNKKTALERSV